MFNRNYKMIIGDETTGTLEFDGLRIKFEIEKSLVGSPNLGRFEIFNLSEDSRNKVKDEFTSIKLFAGYEGETPLIFKGDMRNVNHVFDGVDWITIIYAGDASKDLEQTTIEKQFPAGTTQEQMVKSALNELTNVAEGTLEGIKTCITGKKSILKSYIASGSVKEFLDELSESCGFDYSVNDGVLDTVAKNNSLNDEPVFLINQTTGMIGSPELTEIGADVTVFLAANLKLGRKYKIESLTAKINIGNQFFREVSKSVTNNSYRIDKLKHTGDTHDNVWQTFITGRAVNG